MPLLGDVVVYNTGTGRAPAVIVAVQEDARGIGAESVNIKVFSDSPNGLLQYIKNVTQGDEPGQWQWPDIRVAEKISDIV